MCASMKSAHCSSPFIITHSSRGFLRTHRTGERGLSRAEAFVFYRRSWQLPLSLSLSLSLSPRVPCACALSCEGNAHRVSGHAQHIFFFGASAASAATAGALSLHAVKLLAAVFPMSAAALYEGVTAGGVLVVTPTLACCTSLSRASSSPPSSLRTCAHSSASCAALA